MFRFVLFIIVKFLLLVTSSSQAPKFIYLQPESQLSTRCPVKECHNLSVLVNNDLPIGNSSSITIALLPGVHTYSGNKGIIEISNAMAIEFVAMDQRVRSTIISCNKSNSVGIALSHVSNVSVRGITFEHCGVREGFTLSISYSNNVTIQHLTLRYCEGIALKIENLKNYLSLRNSSLIHNQANMYIYSPSVDNETSNKWIEIDSSLFMSGHYSSEHGDNSWLPKVTNPGITMVLNQTSSYAVVRLINISIHVFPQDVFSTGYCQICSNMHTTSIHMERLHCRTDYVEAVYFLLYGYGAIPGLNIDPRNYTTPSTRIGSITITDSYFNNSRVQIGPILRSSTEFHLKLENVIIQHTLNPLTIVNIGNITLSNITIADCDRVTCISKCKHLSIYNQLTHQRNQGQIMFLHINTVILHENSTVLMNSAQQGLGYPEDWPFYIVGAMVQVFGHSTLTIINSIGRKSGGMVLEETKISFQGESEWVFSNNTGRRGGAMVFKKQSTFSAFSTYKGIAKIRLTNNHAHVKGGAIFVEDSDYIIKGSYLSNDEYKNFAEGANIYFYFENNTAGQAGSAIYGGWIDSSQSKFEFGNQLNTDFSLVSSNPIRLCLCSGSLPSCNRTVYSIELIPGQTFSLGVVAVGQKDGVVPASVLAIDKTSAFLEQTQDTQCVGTKCTNLVYTVRSTDTTETMKLTVASTNVFFASQHDKNIDADLSIIIYLKNCSLGFYLDSKHMKCQCQQILIIHNIECNLTTFKILRESPKWINATFIHLDSPETSGVIVHDHCPFDYCKQTEGYSELNLTNPDEQCSSNRSGILCGACQTNFSRILGTSKCKLCSKHWIALMIPLLAIAGVALVIGLIILNLTVSVGTINGLIFYANVIRANHAIFFPYEISNSFLSIFIAWLNLDLGIEVCFYDDLDAFTITWLQFLFPLYIWLIVLTIIVASHYSTRISKVCGSNAVQVLATLFLLSYAKLLRIIITIFSSTILVFPDGYERKVWLYDGNVDYLRGKHIYLFSVAIALLIFVSIPYTVTLLFVQLLQRFSDCRMLFWVIKLYPLFDAYTGLYKGKHRYWTGLLLLVRVCLFLIFSLNVFGDPKINLLVVLLTALSLCGYNSIMQGVYRNWLLNLIEVSFVSNLGILSAIAHYQFSSGTSITPFTYISVGIALAFSVVILLYHVKMRVTSFKWGKVLKNKLHSFISYKNQIYSTTKTVNIDDKTAVTSSSVDLRELLLTL